MSKTLLLETKNFILPKINFIYKSDEVTDNINQKEYDTLVTYKNKIDELNNHKMWDKSKKLSNEYELIHLPNKKMRGQSIAKYEPLSRSYFKLWEMIVDFKLLLEDGDYVMCGLAEGPGGFIEAYANYRKKKFSKQDKIFGMTLKSVNKDIPGWKKSKMFLNENPNITITYGEDNTGNIYNLDNIKSLRKLVDNNNVDFITADGGFDFSIDFNKQEQLAYRMIFCEIVTALSIQKLGGTFICKIFDIYTNLTIQFIYLLGYFYDEVFITKPFTSRPANSEKYIVCKGFKGITEEYLEELFIIVKKWCITENIDHKIHNIFDINDEKIKEEVLKYNFSNSQLQIDNIVKTLEIIKNKNNLEMYDKIIKLQASNALEWCKKYDLEINCNSSFLQ